MSSSSSQSSNVVAPSTGLRGRRRVVILELQLKQYRRRVFVDLAAALRDHGIDLKVAYSDPNRAEREKADSVELGPDLGIKIPSYWLFGNRLVLQHAWHVIRGADLVVFERGSKVLFNYLLIALSRLGLKRIAFWAHAYNRQSDSPGFSEWLKRKLVAQTDWWFAYTDGEARYLMAQGVPADTITVVHNTIDTHELTDAIRSLPSDARQTTRAQLGIAPSAKVGLFCGSLYSHKKIGFLIESAIAIREVVPEFELVVVGDGPDRAIVREAAKRLPFVHHIGPMFGKQRAKYFAISDVFLNPGLVGLSIVDAFAAGLPVLTTDVPIHSPEIEYLQHGVNGIMSPYDADHYAADVVRVLTERDLLQPMQRAARASADKLTLARMVDSFAGGIVQCIERKRPGAR